MEKSVEGSCQDQRGGKDDSRTNKKRSAAASKLGVTRSTNRGKQVGIGDQSDKSEQSNLTQVSKLPPLPVTKRKFQKTAVTTPKVSSAYNLRNRDEKTEDVKDPPAYNLRSKIRKTEGQNAPSTAAQKKKTPKKDASKDSSQKSGISKPELPKTRSLKSSAPPPAKNIGITKPLTTSLPILDMKNFPSSSQYEPFFHEPMYHIRWEGNDMDHRPFGQNCIICNKDLSGVTEDDDSEFNEDLQYEDDDDDDDDDDYEYYDDVMPTLLPAVDILSCGHAYHTECLQQSTTRDEHSSDPKCVLCSKN